MKHFIIRCFSALIALALMTGAFGALAESVGGIEYGFDSDGTAWAHYIESGAVFQELTIPYSVQEHRVVGIWYNFSYTARALKKLTILADICKDDALTEGPFSNCTELEEVIFESSTIIQMGMFNGCTSLKSVQLPNNLEVIKSHAFENCTSLTEITIPATVTDIWDDAFSGCTALKKVTFLGDLDFYHLPDEDAFNDCPNLTICGMPDSALEWYAAQHGIPYDDGTIKPTTIRITNGKSAELQVTKTLKLKTKLTPSDAVTKLTWKSSDEGIATVSQKGVVTGVKKGTATITVTTKNGKTASIKIKVVAQKPKKVEITNGKKATMKKGKTLKLKTKLTPEAAETKLTWKTSDKRIATVSSKGVVTAKKAGTVKITVTTDNGKKATIIIKVSKK